ncbi:hypothetical protein [Orientia tsutsugamushi]|uniref:Uncharacterized protein n=1 Tax=Orientia tsutsugamushi (strain Boryong) TaxID=357244 RepID=A5CCA9_ORITB|nr:hypothetical protein [Orientia tsutsugamushi]CAM79293.1 conserved hypothetical protein [Orientia tsutsugamushi str. Boryong]
MKKRSTKKYNKVIPVKKQDIDIETTQQQLMKTTSLYENYMQFMYQDSTIIISVLAHVVKTKNSELLQIIESQIHNIKQNYVVFESIIKSMLIHANVNLNLAENQFIVTLLEKLAPFTLENIFDKEKHRYLEYILASAFENKNKELLSLVIKNHSEKIDMDMALDMAVQYNFSSSIAMLPQDKITKTAMTKARADSQRLNYAAVAKALGCTIHVKKKSGPLNTQYKITSKQHATLVKFVTKKKVLYDGLFSYNNYDALMSDFFKVMHSCNKHEINNFIDECIAYITPKNNNDEWNTYTRYAIICLIKISHAFILTTSTAERIIEVVSPILEQNKYWYFLASLYLNKHSIDSLHKAVEATVKMSKTEEETNRNKLLDILKCKVLTQPQNWHEYLDKFPDTIKKLSTTIYRTLTTSVLCEKIANLLSQNNKEDACKYIKDLPEKSLVQDLLQLEYNLKFDSSFDYTTPNTVTTIKTITCRIHDKKTHPMSKPTIYSILYRILNHYYEYYSSLNNCEQYNDILNTIKCKKLYTSYGKKFYLLKYVDNILSLIDDRVKESIIMSTEDKVTYENNLSQEEMQLKQKATKDCTISSQDLLDNENIHNIYTENHSDNLFAHTNLDNEHDLFEIDKASASINKENNTLFTQHSKHQHIHCHIKNQTYCAFDDDIKQVVWRNKTYYCAIDNDLKLDTKYNDFLNALDKGFALSKTGKSGIKYLKTSKIFELKVIGKDYRLVADIIHENIKNNSFIIFNKELNHKEVSKMIQNNNTANSNICLSHMVCNDCNDGVDNNNSLMLKDFNKCCIGEILDTLE